MNEKKQTHGLSYREGEIAGGIFGIEPPDGRRVDDNQLFRGLPLTKHIDKSSQRKFKTWRKRFR